MDKWSIKIRKEKYGKEYYVCHKYKGSLVRSVQRECRLKTSKSHATRIGRHWLDKGLAIEYTITREGE